MCAQEEGRNEVHLMDDDAFNFNLNESDEEEEEEEPSPLVPAAAASCPSAVPIFLETGWLADQFLDP